MTEVKTGHYDSQPFCTLWLKTSPLGNCFNCWLFCDELLKEVRSVEDFESRFFTHHNHTDFEITATNAFQSLLFILLYLESKKTGPGTGKKLQRKWWTHENSQRFVCSMITYPRRRFSLFRRNLRSFASWHSFEPLSAMLWNHMA